MDFIFLCFGSVVAYYGGFFLYLIVVTGFKGPAGETKEDVLLAKGAGLVLAIVIFGTSI